MLTFKFETNSVNEINPENPEIGEEEPAPKFPNKSLNAENLKKYAPFFLVAVLR